MKICIVDDDEDLCLSLEKRLLLEGYKVVFFTSASALLALEEGNRPSFDLLLSDINMPGASGLDLCAEVRRWKSPVRIPIVLVTGFSANQEKLRGIEAGADDFIEKPYSIKELLAKIRHLLGVRKDGIKTIEEMSRLKSFVAPGIGEMLASNESQEYLKQHQKEVTVFFIDLRGFTAFSESAQPSEILQVLEEYYGIVGGHAVSSGGTIGHLAGDGMMVFFNDPQPIENHPAVATRMAIKVKSALEQQKKVWGEKGYDLDFGIGLAVGMTTIGGIGFGQFRHYTVIGAAANLAARFCQSADGGRIFVSHRFLARLGEGFHGTTIGATEIKGMKSKIKIFAITDCSLPEISRLEKK